MNKKENEKPEHFWDEDTLRTANAIWMAKTTVSYLSTLHQSDHEGVIVLPAKVEVLRVVTTPNEKVLFFLKAPYPVFLELVRHVTFEQKMIIDKDLIPVE